MGDETQNKVLSLAKGSCSDGKFVSISKDGICKLTYIHLHHSNNMCSDNFHTNNIQCSIYMCYNNINFLYTVIYNNNMVL